MKKMFIALAALGSITSISSASAQQVDNCPYFLPGFPPEEIFRICEEWRLSQPQVPTRTGDGEQFPGQNCYGVCDVQPY